MATNQFLVIENIPLITNSGLSIINRYISNINKISKKIKSIKGPKIVIDIENRRIIDGANIISFNKISNISENGLEEITIKYIKNREFLISEFCKKYFYYYDINLWQIMDEYIFYLLKRVVETYYAYLRIFNNDNDQYIINCPHSNSLEMNLLTIFTHNKKNIILKYYSNEMVSNIFNDIRFHIVRKIAEDIDGIINYNKVDKNIFKNEKKYKIIIFTSIERHSTFIVPWANKIESDIGIEVIGTKKEWIRNYNNNINYNTYSAYLNKENIKLIKKNIDRFNKIWRSYNPLNIKEYFNFMDINLMDIVNTEFYYTCHKIIPEMIWLIEITKEILKDIKPKISIVMCDLYWTDRLWSTVSHNNGIETAMLQHGFKNDSCIQGNTLIDHLFVFGDSTKMMLIKRGVPNYKIHVVGKPEWDNITTITSDIKTKTKNELNIRDNQKVITLASQPFEKNVQIKLFDLIKSSLNQICDDDLLFINKVHPSEDIDLNIKYFQELKCNKRIMKDIDIFKLLSISDLVITIQSTVGIEARLMGIPVFIIDDPNIMFVSEEYKNSNLFTIIPNSNSLIENIKLFMKNPKSFNISMDLNNEMVLFDGKSSERVAKILSDIVKLK